MKKSDKNLDLGEYRELSEEEMLLAIKFAQDSIKPVVEMIKEFASECSVEKLEITQEDNTELENSINDFAKNDIVNAFEITEKQARVKALEEIKNKIVEKFVSEDADEVLQNKVDFIFKEIEKNVVRQKLLTTGKRIDGRTKDQVRPIVAEIDILPKETVHGSALFTRGETQSLSVLTLGSSYDEQIVDMVGKDIVSAT